MDLNMISIPKTLLNLKDYQQKYIDEHLMREPVYPMISKIIADFLKSCVDEGAFYLRVPAKNLQKIIDSGKIKSCVEEGADKGTTFGGAEARKILVQNLFGADISMLAPEDYPKFGYLSQSDANKEPLLTYELSYQYGSVIFKLKKENLISRTTLTVGDSVNFARFNLMVATLTSDIKATCIMGPRHTKDKLNINVNPPLINYQLLLRELWSKALTPKNFYKLDEIMDGVNNCFEFFELQYHGDLSLTNDVEEVVLIKDEFSEGCDYDSFIKGFEKLGVKFTLKETF